MTAAADLFIWPGFRIRSALAKAVRPVKPEYIEHRLAALFPGAFPVLTSSGRQALGIAVACMGIGRSELVEIFPYASHCVHSAVSRHATPAPAGLAQSGKRIRYHQWGYVQPGSNIAIEDAVDTLCAPGAGLFPCNAPFEIWSLNKILGTASGGVLWCSSNDEAIRARKIRDSGQISSLGLWALRLMGKASRTAHLLWHGGAADAARPSRLECGEILSKIDSWDMLVEDRKAKRDIVAHLASPLMPPQQADRYPCVIGIEPDEKALTVLQHAFPSIEPRHFSLYENNVLKSNHKVCPVPIHQDVPVPLLEAVARALGDS